MKSRLELFRGVARAITRGNQVPARKLYTDHIYPYPFRYFNEKIYPSQLCYRETWPKPKWVDWHDKMGTLLMRIFWTGWFYQLFSDPGVILGHTHLPDPAQWTDAELGIPPEEYGTYEDWLNKKEAGQA